MIEHLNNTLFLILVMSVNLARLFEASYDIYMITTTRTAGSPVYLKVAAVSTQGCPRLFFLYPIPLFPSSLLFMCHSHLLQLEGRCVWPQLAIILAQIVLGPPCLSHNLSCSCPVTSPAILKAFSQPMINPLSSDSDMIKGKASKHFMEVITHSLAICLTSMPSWHWQRLN